MPRRCRFEQQSQSLIRQQRLFCLPSQRNSTADLSGRMRICGYSRRHLNMAHHVLEREIGAKYCDAHSMIARGRRRRSSCPVCRPQTVSASALRRVAVVSTAYLEELLSLSHCRLTDVVVVVVAPLLLHAHCWASVNHQRPLFLIFTDHVLFA